MADLGVPPRHRGPLRRLAELADEDGDRLVEELTALPAFTAMPDVASRLQGVTRGGTASEARDLAEALISLTAQRGIWASDELAARVSRSEDLAVAEEERESFARLLAGLIEAQALVTMGKAIDVMTEHEHIFQSARIMTDIRPIFEDEPSSRPTGAAILSLLVINHSTDGQRKSIEFAMDRADLHALRAGVERAITKIESLRALVTEAGLTDFEYEEVNERD